MITPEAVVLDFSTAGVGSRVGSQVIDLILQGTGLVVTGLTVGALTDLGGYSWVGVTIGLFLVFGFVFGYSALFETFMGGRTPGKAVLGLQVVTIEGGPISFRHAAIRSAFGVIEVLGTGGVLAFVVVFLTARNQRIGDLVAGTLVLRQRFGSEAPVATHFVPVPGTEMFAESLDVSSLTTEEYQVVRSFLLRAESLDAAARDTLANQLGAQMVQRLGTQPLPGMTAGQYLMAVAAAYQRRFAQRGV